MKKKKLMPLSYKVKNGRISFRVDSKLEHDFEELCRNLGHSKSDFGRLCLNTIIHRMRDYAKQNRLTFEETKTRIIQTKWDEDLKGHGTIERIVKNESVKLKGGTI